MNVAQMSHFETDLTWASKQRFSEQLCVWVAASQVRGAPSGFDGHLIRRGRFHVPVGRPTATGRAKTGWAPSGDSPNLHHIHLAFAKSFKTQSRITIFNKCAGLGDVEPEYKMVYAVYQH